MGTPCGGMASSRRKPAPAGICGFGFHAQRYAEGTISIW
jgi:hypothetical protein